jgi:hypothetical protein
MDHNIPQSPELIEAVKWLDEKLDDRRRLAEVTPTTRIGGDQDPPSREAQASALLDDAVAWMKETDSKFDGQMLLKGILMRWVDTDAARQAEEILKQDLEWQKTERDHLRQYVLHRCRGFDRFALEEKHEHYQSQRVPRLQWAIKSWTAIIKDGGDPVAVSEARQRITVLREILDELDTPPDSTDK